MKRFVKSVVCLVLVLTMSLSSVPLGGLSGGGTQAEAAQKTYSLNKNIKHLSKNARFVLRVQGGAKKVAWVSSNKKIATVKKKTKTSAVVTAKKTGVCEIVAKVGGQKLSCLIQVTDSTKKAGTFKKGAFYIGKKKVYTLKEALSSKGGDFDFGDARYLYIGASRTKNTAHAVKDPEVFFYSYAGCGIDCLFRRMYSDQEWKPAGLKVIDCFLKQRPQGMVLIDLGGNDLRNIKAYINLYKTLIRRYPSAQFRFICVLPRQDGTNEKRMNFNKKLKKAFPGRVVDLYSFVLTNRLFCTVDGVHYAPDLCRVIYEQLMRSIGRDISVNVLTGEVLLPGADNEDMEPSPDTGSGDGENTGDTTGPEEGETQPDPGSGADGTGSHTGSDAR